MNQPSEPAICIDLGTTFSCVSRLDDLGRPMTLDNAEGDHSTPSVILFDGEEVVVGKEASKAKGTDMIHIAECTKRELGERFRKNTGGSPVSTRSTPGIHSQQASRRCSTTTG